MISHASFRELRYLRVCLSFSIGGIWDFFDALVALGFLQREGDGREALYSNTEETALYLDKNNGAYIGGILEMRPVQDLENS